MSELRERTGGTAGGDLLGDDLEEKLTARSYRLAHGWRLTDRANVSNETLRDFIRPAVRAVPRSLAERIGTCLLILTPAAAFQSQWAWTPDGLRVEIAAGGVDPHDLGIEALLCIGQALWEKTAAPERTAYLRLLAQEIDANVSGEIDEDALSEKQRLFSNPRSRRRLERYAAASFASTTAEYVHALWHNVTVRTGPEHLPDIWLRRRFEMLARWFPPDRGHRLFG